VWIVSNRIRLVAVQTPFLQFIPGATLGFTSVHCTDNATISGQLMAASQRERHMDVIELNGR
jgi:hypothetical protein